MGYRLRIATRIFLRRRTKSDDSKKNDIKIKEAQLENMNKLIKIKDDNIIKLKEDIKKLVEDNIKLIKELEKKYTI